MLALLREGADRSATFRALVDAIGQSNGIVYIEFGYCAFGHLSGCLLPFIASSHGDRYLRVIVTPHKSHDQLLALIAHELRHALEVLERAEVVDVASLETMYRNIGTPVAGQHSVYETSAARASGDAVLGELAAKRAALGRDREDVQLTAPRVAHSR